MTAHRYDPYLWVHFSGLATVPFWLILCLLGLAVGYPTLPALELSLVIGFGVLPVLYMQLRRPFCVFSLLFLSLKSTAISKNQRRLLTIFRSWRVRLAAPFVALSLAWCLQYLYRVAPVAHRITPFAEWGRVEGLAIAAVSCCAASLFLQVPVSVLLVWVTSEKSLQDTVPYSTEAINRDFCHFGLPVSAILPSVVPPSHPQEPLQIPEIENRQAISTSDNLEHSVDEQMPSSLQDSRPADQNSSLDEQASGMREAYTK